MTEEDKGYEVIDKRKVKQHEEPAPEAETEATKAQEGEAAAQPEQEEARAEEPKPEEAKEEAKEEPGPELPPADVYSLLKSFIGLLGAHAWQRMGLMVDPITGKLEKDLTQAKVAIDSISALTKQMEGKLDPKEREEIQAMLSNLQINYVRQSEA